LARIKQTIAEKFPLYSNSPEYPALLKLRDTLILAEYDARDKPWPGVKGKYVSFWWVLEGGKILGMNENPSRGLSFVAAKR
jgi:hypothetical protein